MRVNAGKTSMPNQLTRRGAIGGAAALAPALAFAQTKKPEVAIPPSVVTQPPRLWGRFAPPEIYPDPDILVIDGSFNQYLVGLTAIHRLWTGAQWAEGPAWSAEGQYARVQRCEGQHAVSLYLGKRRGHAVPQAVVQQQRQRLRLPGPPAFDPGFLPPRGAVGAGRIDDGDRRFVRGQAAEFAQRPGAASRRQHLVHRPALWRAAFRGPSGCRRRAGQPERPV